MPSKDQASVERKLTTIVAADVAGYSRLIAADEEATLLALSAHRSELIDPLLSQHDGRLANSAGDSLLIEFPSAVSAMRCAIAIQDGMAKRNAKTAADRQLVFRIGVNVGDVVVSGSDLLGDGVNVAARLEQQAEPGEILISRSVRDAVRDRLNLRIEDLGSIAVKNIPRPVRAFRILPGSAATSDLAPPRNAGAPAKSRGAFVALAAVVCLCGAIVAWWQWPAGHTDTTSDLVTAAPRSLGEGSIAVLPFEAAGTDEADRRLAAGLAEDITGVLSRFSTLAVISSESTAVYRDTATTPEQVATDLGVAHVLTGTVDRQGDAVRINVKLLDGQTGRKVWSERFDVDGTDIFAVRDDVARSIGAQLGEPFGPMAAQTLARSIRKDTDALEAYELVLLAAEFRHRFTKEGSAKSAELLTHAVTLDPHYARAYVDLAWTFWQDVLNGLTEDASASMQKARVNAEKAIEADPYLSDAYWVLGSLEMCSDDTPDDAVELFRKAIELNPNHQSLLAEWGGYILPQTLDQADEGVRLVERAIRLNPSNPDWYDGAYVAALYFAERPEDAIRAYATVDQPQLPVQLYYAAALGHVGRVEDAQPVIQQIREVMPGLSLTTLDEGPEFCMVAMSDRAEQYLRQGLEKAGLPQ
ncbi:MAG: adenylate/guanylate cyclase domain-containing protein [Roseobacter sp.]|nr:adenylate/guanylate cyclase domain-containing protein [Roseobacter sp.]